MPSASMARSHERVRRTRELWSPQTFQFQMYEEPRIRSPSHNRSLPLLASALSALVASRWSLRMNNSVEGAAIMALQSLNQLDHDMIGAISIVERGEEVVRTMLVTTDDSASSAHDFPSFLAGDKALDCVGNPERVLESSFKAKPRSESCLIPRTLSQYDGQWRDA